MSFRLLPFLIFSCLLFLCVRLADVVQGGNLFSNNLLVATGFAESEKKAEEGHGDKAKEGKEGEAKKEEKKDDKEKPAIIVSETPPANVVKPQEGPQFTPAEIEVLQRLRQRREQIEAREKELEVREKVLRVTEGKIEQKIADLNGLKQQVESLLNAYNAKEDSKVLSLVKIYENMKPKDAARIFEELDMQTLLPVIDKMKEAKVAPVLAQMDPKKAKAITTELSQMRRLPSAETTVQN